MSTRFDISMSTLFRKQGVCKWPNPKESIGDLIRFDGLNKRYSCWEAVGPARKVFDEELGPTIEAYINSCAPLDNSLLFISFCMIGKTEDTASPKIVLSCKDRATRKKVRELVQNSSIMSKFSGIGLADSSVAPGQDPKLMAGDNVLNAGLVQVPSTIWFGDRLTIVPNLERPHERRLATAGPIFYWGNRVYCLTVSHIFKATEPPLDSETPEDCDFDDISDDEPEQAPDDDLQLMSKGSVTPENVLGVREVQTDSSTSPSQEDKTSTNIQEETGTFESFPKDTLLSSQQGIVHEPLPFLAYSSHLDYVLIDVTDNRNPQSLPSQIYCGHLPVTKIALIDDHSANVWALTASSGIISGVLRPWHSLMRLPGERSVVKVYPIRLHQPLKEGDSGAAIIDSTTGDFYGHIVAGTPGTGSAYIIAARDIFDDITGQLGGKPITFPGTSTHQLPTEARKERPGESNESYSSMTMTSYQYTRLWSGEIRLLKLFPGYGDSILEGTLAVRNLVGSGNASGKSFYPPPESFDALSYTWDDQKPTGYIRIREYHDQYNSTLHLIHIRPNLIAALKRLRQLAEPRYLWVDALCINQNDNHEKSDQIPLIFQIFNMAKNVCIWLGTGNEDSQIAFQFMRKLMSDDFGQLVKDIAFSQQWASFSNLMKYPWFRRRWIVQEIAVSQNATIYCGNDFVSWDKFAFAVSLLAYRQAEIEKAVYESSSFYNKLDHFDDIRECAGVRLVRIVDDIFRRGDDSQIIERMLTLEQLMSTLSGFETSDPRDVLYAVISLAHDARPGFRNAFKSRNMDDTERHAYPFLGEQLVTSPRSYTWELSPALVPKTVSYLEPDLGLVRRSDPGRPEPFNYPRVRSKRRASTNTEPDEYPLKRQHTEQVPKITIDSPSASLIPPSPLSQKDRVATTTTSSFGDGLNSEKATHEDNSTSYLTVPLTPRPSSSGSYFAITARQEELAKIFIRKLRERTIKDRIPVDYDKSVVEVCRDVLKFIIARSHSLDIICRPWAPDEKSFPSWLLSASRKPFGEDNNGVFHRINADPLVGQPERGPCFYKAARGLPAIVRFDEENKNSLMARGFVLSVVKERRWPALEGVIPLEWNELANWKDTNTPPPGPFWRTLVGNRDLSGRHPQRLWQRACQNAFMRRPKGGDLRVKEIVAEHSSTFVNEYLERVLQTVWGRQLAILESFPVEQSLSLIPRGAKEGDKVCILYGCSVPLLLREVNETVTSSSIGDSSESSRDKKPMVSESRVTYKIIGECYVHGMMDGEAARYRQSHSIEEQYFDLN